MKLVEILAKEFVEWPIGVVNLVQNGTQTVEGYDEDCGKLNPETDCWDGCAYTGFCRQDIQLASDYRAAIVTRADWEAEKMKQAKPAEQENKWIRHRGGKCPVEAGAKVEVRRRNGAIEKIVELDINNVDETWLHVGDKDDIMAYRMHKPDQQTAKTGKLELEVTANTEGVREVIEEMQMQIDQIDGPIKWRDRIREIDTTVEALEEERASLIQRLEDEGFKLARVGAKVAPKPKEPDADMSDWRNWRAGDNLRAVGRCGGFSFAGEIVKVLVMRDDGLEVATEEEPEYGWFFTECEAGEDLKFHSRT